MTITPEERIFWRHYLELPDCVFIGPQPITLRLLNALEAAEARAEQAEAELDVLAKYALGTAYPPACPHEEINYCPHGIDTDYCHRDTEADAKGCWLTWAKAEARKRGE